MSMSVFSYVGHAEKKREISLKTVDWNGVQKLVQRNKGKVVVLDIWTTTCGICREEFPKFVQLHKSFDRKDVVCISVNCDYDGIEEKPPKFYYKQVTEFLAKHDATFKNVILDVAFIDFLDQMKLHSTPAVFVYDRTGKLAHRFDNDKVEKVEDEFTMKQVEQLVRKVSSAKIKKPIEK